MRLVFVAAALCLAMFASAQSQPQQIPRPTNESADYQQIRTNDALETIASQLSAIREQTARIEKARTDREANPFWPPIWSNWFLIFLTGGAVVAAFITLGKLERQAKASENAANAATISAQVATTTLHVGQRAYLNVLEVYLDDFGPGKFPILVAVVQNSGHIPATVFSLSATINFVTVLANPRVAELNWIPINSVAPPGQVVKLSNHPLPNAPGFTVEQWNAIAAGNFYVAVFGAIRYQAGFNIIGETGFGYVFHANLFPHLEFHKKFATIDFPGYNYSK